MAENKEEILKKRYAFNTGTIMGMLYFVLVKHCPCHVNRNHQCSINVQIIVA